MLSAFKTAAGRVAQCSRRSFATAAQAEPSALNPLLGLQHTGVTAEAGLVQALPVTQPLLLPMSALVRPKPDEPSEEKFVELDPHVFAHPIRRDILHLCVVHHLDNLRQGTASTKTRGEVRGSGKKIRPQKGTGQARLGDGQSPMLRGGGIAFGPKPRDFGTKLPRKVIQMGMRVALSARVKERSLGVVESLDWPTPKTKDLAARLRDLGWGKTLFVTGQDEVPEGLRRASGNIYNVDTITADELVVYDAVKWPRLVLDLAAVQWLEQTLGRSIDVSSL